MTTQIRPQMIDQPGIRFGIANGALVTALLVAGVAGLDHVETGLICLAVTGLASAGVSTLAGAAMGVVSWAMFTGFVENRYGQLTFAAGDLERLAVFLVGVLAFAAFAQHAHLASREAAHE